jgi:hypothetical protein
MGALKTILDNHLDARGPEDDHFFDLRRELREFLRTRGSALAAVMAGKAAPVDRDFVSRVEATLGSLGRAFILPRQRLLAVFDGRIDGELAAFHLSKVYSLETLSLAKTEVGQDWLDAARSVIEAVEKADACT